ncbi:hypothetical protein D3C75_832830 [compost metagenome]
MGEIPVLLHANAYTIPAAISPPTKAAIGINSVYCGAASIMTSTHAAAPLVTPVNPGSASGLPITACSRAPETAIFAPMIIASNTRGKRISHMMVAFTAFAADPKIVLRMSGMGMYTEPSPIAIMAATSASANVTITIILLRDVFITCCLL